MGSLTLREYLEEKIKSLLLSKDPYSKCCGDRSVPMEVFNTQTTDPSVSVTLSFGYQDPQILGLQVLDSLCGKLFLGRHNTHTHTVNLVTLDSEPTTDHQRPKW